VTSDLDELVEVLRRIQALVLQGRDLFDGDPRQRWSIERLWIHAGNLANDLGPGVIPDDVVGDLVGVRIVYAHIWPSNLDSNRVWEDSQEIHDILTQVDGS
jgi:hypothetical protein